MKDHESTLSCGETGEGAGQAWDTAKESALMSSEKSPERLVSSLQFLHLV